MALQGAESAYLGGSIGLERTKPPRAESAIRLHASTRKVAQQLPLRRERAG
jgi:hypothetical protein